ncbi:MAG: hypothetical protein FRX49_10008 [Trebouxia sp. A1-2]|nr:MAG: hypothetical protein FRX49_10008 [Trebouxia sp. A1-2]
MQPVAQEQPITRRIPTAKRSLRTRKVDILPFPRPRPLTREQRKRLHNRASQRQWRERQKTRAEDLEAQVEATTAQLKQLQTKQQQLEARNALLEIGNPDEKAQHIYSLGNVDLTDLMRDDTQQTLILTVMDGPAQVKTRQDVSNMSLDEFAMLTAAYARKLGDCLAELTKPAIISSKPALKSGAAAKSSALNQLRQWTQECSSLRVFLVVGNPKNFMAYISDRLDGKPGLRTCELGTEWYHDLLAAMQFTEAQQQDLMLLRRLFYGKLGVLARERKECLKRMPFGAATTAHEVNSRLAEVVTIAQELHDITAAEFQTKLEFTSAYRRGIYTLIQQAMSMVKAFPYVAEKPQIFDVMAAERGELSARELMQPAGLDNIEHNAKWQQMVQYLATVTADNLDLHVPIVIASS